MNRAVLETDPDIAGLDHGRAGGLSRDAGDDRGEVPVLDEILSGILTAEESLLNAEVHETLGRIGAVSLDRKGPLVPGSSVGENGVRFDALVYGLDEIACREAVSDLGVRGIDDGQVPIPALQTVPEQAREDASNGGPVILEPCISNVVFPRTVADVDTVDERRADSSDVGILVTVLAGRRAGRQPPLIDAPIGAHIELGRSRGRVRAESEGVMIQMQEAGEIGYGRECHSPVGRTEDLLEGEIDVVRILGIDADRHVVVGLILVKLSSPLPGLWHLLPVLHAADQFEESLELGFTRVRIIVLDAGVERHRVGDTGAQSGLAEDDVAEGPGDRHAVEQLGRLRKGRTQIGGFVDALAGNGGVHDVAVLGVQAKVRDAPRENGLAVVEVPRDRGTEMSAPVDRAIQTLVLRGSAGAARGDQHDVRSRKDDPADSQVPDDRPEETSVGDEPSRTLVHRLVNPDTHVKGRVRSEDGACPGVQYVPIHGNEGDRAEGKGAQPVGQRPPGQPCVFRLPDSAAGSGDVDLVVGGSARIHRDVGDRPGQGHRGDLGPQGRRPDLLPETAGLHFHVVKVLDRLAPEVRRRNAGRIQVPAKARRFGFGLAPFSFLERIDFRHCRFSLPIGIPLPLASASASLHFPSRRPAGGWHLRWN